MNKYLKFIFYNACDTDGQLYQLGWKQYFYLDCDLTSPVYEIQKEVREDLRKRQIPKSQLWQKKYELKIGYCPEFFVDALYHMFLCDNIQVITKNNVTLTVRDISINAEWKEDCIAEVKIKFTTDSLFLGNCCTQKAVSILA